MRLNFVHCEHCQNTFQSDQQNCPFCGRRSPQGRRNLRLKWVAVLIFLIALAFVAYTIIHAR